MWQQENERGFALTHRERQVLKLIGDGKSNREIGRLLGITERTVKAHVSKVLLKLRVNSRLHAGLMARHMAALPGPGTSTNGQ